MANVVRRSNKLGDVFQTDDNSNAYFSLGTLIAGEDLTNNLLYVEGKNNWSVQLAAAVGVQGTVTKAAGGAGVKHVCTGVIASFVAGTAAPAAVVATVNLRDGATGAGTVLATWYMSLPATAGASSAPVVLSGINIPGSANTAMTLEFAAAGGANTFESVTLIGYDAS